jgi:pimeloyl-ACP methyl ester carboxylesterase
MHAIFFLPGILGSKLLLGTEEVWPPTLSEITFGYERINKLVDPACVPGEVIRQVCIRPIYGPILDDVRELVGGDATHVREFPYDWRRDIRETADDFAAALEATVANGAEHVSVVAHSMGGLVARLALEDPRHAASPWLAKVSDLLLLTAPQLGAPLALARALGLVSCT